MSNRLVLTGILAALALGGILCIAPAAEAQYYGGHHPPGMCAPRPQHNHWGYTPRPSRPHHYYVDYYPAPPRPRPHYWGYTPAPPRPRPHYAGFCPPPPPPPCVHHPPHHMPGPGPSIVWMD